MFINQNDGYQGPFSISLRSNGECSCVTLWHFRHNVTYLMVLCPRRNDDYRRNYRRCYYYYFIIRARAYRRGYPRLMERGCVADSRAQWWWGCCFFSRDTGVPLAALERRTIGARGNTGAGGTVEKAEESEQGQQMEREGEKWGGNSGKGVPTHCSRHYANLRARMYAR